MRRNWSYQCRPVWLNSKIPAFVLPRCATSRWFFGILATFLFLIMVGQASADVFSIYAPESEGRLSARLHLPRAQPFTARHPSDIGCESRAACGYGALRFPS